MKNPPEPKDAERPSIDGKNPANAETESRSRIEFQHGDQNMNPEELKASRKEAELQLATQWP